MRWPRRQSIEYVGLLAASFLIATAASWTDLGRRIDNDAYDWFMRLAPAPAQSTRSVLVALDDESLRGVGGTRNLRTAIAESLELLAPLKPAAVAIDVILPDKGDPVEDARLEAAIRATPNVLLACDLLPRGDGWEDPIDRFRRHADGVGHVHAEPDPVTREILLEKAAGRDRRWALALETFRILQGQPVVETPSDLQVGDVVIPSARTDHRVLRIRYAPPERPVATVPLKELRAGRGGDLRGRVVFLGVTGQLIARDRLQTPYTDRTTVAGVEIHVNVFETIAQQMFLTPVSALLTSLLGLALMAAAGVVFGRMQGWPAYAAGGAMIVLAHLAPYVAFTQSRVLAYTPIVLCAWLSIGAAASYQHFVARRRMLKAEGDKQRYQQAMHFVTHEMRTPLTAIQGSSELIGRYALNDEKRKQIAQLINSESKRLGKMIEVFLNVERLSAGQMELRRERFDGAELMHACIERVRPVADRKQISISLDEDFEAPLTGDRELMDYAFYNLLTNAVKYSPQRTEVNVFSRRQGENVLVSVKDQGIGMDQKEARQIFQKFYRTKKAEESGEAGTGIGLSIVEQIVVQHGGAIEVASSPGQGSCFTLVLPVATQLPAPETVRETVD